MEKSIFEDKLRLENMKRQRTIEEKQCKEFFEKIHEEERSTSSDKNSRNWKMLSGNSEGKNLKRGGLKLQNRNELRQNYGMQKNKNEKKNLREQ